MDVTWFLAQQEPTNLYVFFSSVMKHETNSFFLIFAPLYQENTYILFLTLGVMTSHDPFP